jgi:uncharacterized membrane protein
MAVLAHALQMVGGWIAPLVIFFTKRQSRFVSFHALQVLLLQGVKIVFVIIFMMLWMAFVVFTILSERSHHSDPPLAMIAIFLTLWLVWFGFWIFTLVLAILHSIKAGRGEWAEYPIFGKIARRILKLGPGGVPLEA